ncbi:Small GTPase superfamily Rab type [Penicillium capsulatum]|uniref:MICOS complex subunit MIC60 n=1 Tax=Penicillium capsulatum TaxID=69766 RepID=A0A9W9HU44_9EURO|nr:Small GTPase superfamily Rab type [Penicillium capsulatum]KAJ6106901.1 Small GTPase superfamily Rab type [Penicillium capsulatum]
MLRSSIAPSRQLLSAPGRQRVPSQWLSRAGASSRLSGQRFFADSKPPSSDGPTPVTPSSTSIPPEVPKPTEQGIANTFANIIISHHTNPYRMTGSHTPPVSPATPAPKTGRFRRFLLYLILTSGLAYGGSIFLALKSDNFHDFFTEYIPYGEECVLYFEERDFYRRFPNASRHSNRIVAAPRDEGNPVTIPSKSGLSWKVSHEEDAGSDVSKSGPHMSAKAHEGQTKSATAKPEERDAAVHKAKEDKAAKSASKKGEKPAAKDETKQVSLDQPRQPAVPDQTIQLLQMKDGDEAVVQELVKTFNDMVTVISADENASKYSAPVAKAKEELFKIGEKISAIRSEARGAAEEEIKKVHETFDESARELLRRVEETRASDLAQFREEFEAEREKLAAAYQEKIKTELVRAQELSEQRLKNELVEQAIELNRKYVHEVKDLVEREREGRLSKLNELTSNIAELEKLTSGWSTVIDTNLKTQQLQVAVDAVRSVLERSETPRPFIRELVAVKELSAEDPVVEAAIASINPTAYQRGIPSTAQIMERFRRVAGEVRKASLLPEDAGIASHAASMVLSKVMFKKDALANGNDVESILVRTENWLEEGNVDAAAREMNGLQGWAKILSKDWLGDVRRVLEVKQALEVIETEARLQCLRVE